MSTNLFVFQYVFFIVIFSVNGKKVRTVAYSTFSEENDAPNGKETVTYEARKIKCLLIKLQNY